MVLNDCFDLFFEGWHVLRIGFSMGFGVVENCYLNSLKFIKRIQIRIKLSKRCKSKVYSLIFQIFNKSWLFSFFVPKHFNFVLVNNFNFLFLIFKNVQNQLAIVFCLTNFYTLFEFLKLFYKPMIRIYTLKTHLNVLKVRQFRIDFCQVIGAIILLYDKSANRE